MTPARHAYAIILVEDMRNKITIIAAALVGLGAIAGLVLLLKDANFAVLNPMGEIAEKQRTLIYFAAALSVLVVAPVFTMLYFIVRNYRDDSKNKKHGKKADYKPDWDSHKLAETVWWGVPIALILVLSVVIWFSSHDLDPYKKLSSKQPPVRVQVVALQWKWLFIYPEQNIASVNTLTIPAHRPINFEITSDAPMNSFWIPQLGGQVYAMTGMTTKLHLIAEQAGVYNGSSANISGGGFAGMKFKTYAVSDADFTAWVQQTQQANNPLTTDEYTELARPSKNVAPSLFSSADRGLYATVINKYTSSGYDDPWTTGHESTDEHSHEGNHH
ncbi:MAG: ubiquinol oxidase subunit II [Candidatus Saccharimonadales bacterium]